MTEKETRSGQAADLHRQAEEIAREKEAQSPENLEAMSLEETQQTLHELRVHQIELEIQNEELRRAQVELEAARDRYFNFYDLAPVGYCTVSEKGLILEANLTAATLLGTARGALVKQPISRFILKEDQDIYYLHYNQLFETAEPQVYELRMLKKDGTAFWARQETTAAQDTDGAPTCRILMSNITERKQTEEALRESEERYRRIADTVTDYIFTSYIENGKVVKTVHGPGCIAVTGYSAEEFAADPYLWFNMVFPEDHDRVKKYASRILTGKNLDPVEHRIRRKDGRVRWVLNTPVPHHDSSGALISYDGLISDITLRKRAEEALRQTEENFRRSLDESPLGVRIVTEEGETVYANRAILDIHDYDSIEEYKTTPAEKRYTPEGYAEFKIRRDKRRQGVDVPFEYAINIIRKNGEVRHLQVFRKEILWDGKRQFQVIYQDLTERNQAEEEKRILQERLQQADKMEAIGTLAGGIAHDFNNLLMGIQGYVSLTLLDLDPSHPHYERLRRIEEQVQSGADLTKQLMGFARGGRYEVKPADLNDILKKSSSMFGRTKKEITIHRKYGKDLRTVEVDRGRWSRYS